MNNEIKTCGNCLSRCGVVCTKSNNNRTISFDDKAENCLLGWEPDYNLLKSENEQLKNLLKLAGKLVMAVELVINSNVLEKNKLDKYNNVIYKGNIDKEEKDEQKFKGFEDHRGEPGYWDGMDYD